MFYLFVVLLGLKQINLKPLKLIDSCNNALFCYEIFRPSSTFLAKAQVTSDSVIMIYFDLAIQLIDLNHSNLPLNLSSNLV
jgi:hypothetical protein